MRRALLAGGLLLSGCSFVYSLDGLSGGALTPDPHAGEDAMASDVVVQVEKDATTPSEASAMSRYRAAVMADSPALYLRFGEAAGAANVRTEVGTTTATYGDGMTLGAPGALTGDPDTAIHFTQGIIVLPPGVECAGAIDCAVEAWIRVDKYPENYGWLIDHEVWEGERHGWNLELSSTGTFQYERWPGDGTTSAVSTQIKFPLDEWHHVIAIRDGSGQRVYFDGAVRENHPTSKTFPASGIKWTIGGDSCFACADRHWFEGSLDELAIYEHSISEERINAHLAAARAP